MAGTVQRRQVESSGREGKKEKFQNVRSEETTWSAQQKKPVTVMRVREILWGYSSVGRAPALQAGGQGFEPLYLHYIGFAPLAHLVEHFTCNEEVVGSSPTGGSESLPNKAPGDFRPSRTHSSVGRALPLHGRCREFEPLCVHYSPRGCICGKP